ncbi:MAG: hypothetical protein V2J02_17250 [Pseudomonadales bacterium]|jgi:hypothetical protein|nr:hypothetical protein [Pseudomonadales bacterium]
MARHDWPRVVTVYAQPASGPGWGNSPVWVVLRERDGTLRQECIQPEDQTAGMRHLYRIASEVHRQMVREARVALKGEGA